jgi:ethanolamine utilization protein EutA
MGISAVTFSGGVSEFVHGRATQSFGDLAPLLAAELQRRIGELGAPVVTTQAGIRATVIGASQYTIQVSGSTVFVSPLETVPIRNIPVVTPAFPWREQLSVGEVADSLKAALRLFELEAGTVPVAVGLRWQGTASYARIRAFCEGLEIGMNAQIECGQPLILVFDGDVGGLIGLHLRETGTTVPIISIDGIDLRQFDYIDIGAMIPTSGVVPVVVKSLVFSTSQPRQEIPRDDAVRRAHR